MKWGVPMQVLQPPPSSQPPSRPSAPSLPTAPFSAQPEGSVQLRPWGLGQHPHSHPAGSLHPGGAAGATSALHQY